MRRFDAEYLRDTRTGMWEDRQALADLDLANRRRVVDVGCGTGVLTRVLAEESAGAVIGVDADPQLLAAAGDAFHEAPSDWIDPELVAGDATRLPLADDGADLVVCQALLINLPDPGAAVEEFARVSSDLVAAVEPDNAAVTVESTVAAEGRLERRARSAYLQGVDTDVTLGAAPDLFRSVGLTDVRTRRYDHVRTVEAPYSERDLEAARRKVTGEGLDSDRATMQAGGMTDEEYDQLRTEWRSMGRDVVAAMQDGDYRREETVPFYVTVGRVPDERT